jgi:endonuclease YncB( thermonuclease family)
MPLSRILIALALGLTTTAFTRGGVISGPAFVIDADTVVVDGTKVRLKGVDAAELGTPLGETAKRRMQALVPGALVCTLTGERTYDREVGFCRTPAGLDVNREIVRLGAALACPRYDARYLADERPEARAVQPRSSYCVAR